MSAAAAKRSTKKRTIPKNIADAADMYQTVKDERLAAQKLVDETEKFEKELKEHLINTIPKSKLGGVAGKLVRVEVYKEDIPTIVDKKKFLAAIRKSGEFDLISTSLNTKAARERWDAKKTIPGVGKFTAVKLSVHKLKGGK